MKNKRNYLIKVSLKRKLLSKWFLGINIILFLLILVSFNIDSIITFFGGDFKNNKTVLITDKVGIYKDFKEQFLDISKVTVTKYNLKYVTELNKDSFREDVIGIELLPDSNNIIRANVYTLKGLSTINKNIISSSLNNIKRKLALEKFNITQDKMNKIEKNVELNSVVLSGKSVNENKDISSSVIIIVFVIPCFFLITTLVQMIGSEINEEKTTKSMEIIISNVAAKDHLISKIISCVTFTFIQVILLFIFVIIASLFHSKSIGILSESSTYSFSNVILNNMFSGYFFDSIKEVLPILLLSFTFTIITYSLLAGVLASMTTNIDDFQQLQTPVMMIISLSFYLSLLTVFFEGSLFIKIMSYIPLISFMISPTLYVLGQISFTSVIISTFIEFLFMILIYHYGIKIYRIGILNYSGNHLWKKIIGALKTN